MRESEEPSPAGGPIFERMVDRALGHPGITAAIGVTGAGPTREQLRARALEARDRLAGIAADEYRHYLALRAAAAHRDRPEGDGDDRMQKRLLPALAILVPSLGAAATGVFLLCGFGLRAFAVRPHIGDGLVMSGVIAAVVTAGAALGDLAWLLAARARTRRDDGEDPMDRDPRVRRAREVWERALLERAIIPFLLEHANLERAGLEHAEKRAPWVAP
ncbi:hypothetical protein SY2F82_41300 [Streptomyces sp. Y2F8-2]|uniref:hypothetical protein n=1 Tax=unclassified Streptomyces TaxID=2593676 RepID=UPI001902E096|nr:hypothetical protein [Streptomyces sp. Y2F8-2]GHK02333.1 hypothetical protein SY2F82_41300 [Streptomyces sp. Y2F8-2]